MSPGDSQWLAGLPTQDVLPWPQGGRECGTCRHCCVLTQPWAVTLPHLLSPFPVSEPKQPLLLAWIGCQESKLKNRNFSTRFSNLSSRPRAPKDSAPTLGSWAHLDFHPLPIPATPHHPTSSPASVPSLPGIRDALPGRSSADYLSTPWRRKREV